MDKIKSESPSYSNRDLLSSKMLGSCSLDNKILSELSSKYNEQKFNLEPSLSRPSLLLTTNYPKLQKHEQLNIKTNTENTLLKSKPHVLQNKYLLKDQLTSESSYILRKRQAALEHLESNVSKLLKLSILTDNRNLNHLSRVNISSTHECPMDYTRSWSEESMSSVSDQNEEFEPHLYNLEFGSFSPECSVDDQILERTGSDQVIVAQLQEEKLKMKLMHTVSASLIPGSNMREPDNPLRKKMLEIFNVVADIDPEFILKVALYTREELNIRTVSNLLLAFAAYNNKCRLYLLKYFSACVRLPSDWIEVADLYQHFEDKTVKPGSLPASLRKAMAAKFPDFDSYQLAKYNNEKKMKKKRKKQKLEKLEKEQESPTYSEALKSTFNDGDMDLENEEKNYKQFTLKQLVRLLHLTKPTEFVMSLLGKKYPSDVSSFYKSGLPGFWIEEQAGKRMKLPLPETWETQISLKGNKASVWEQLLDNKKLPFMAMLRNLRNFILSGVSHKHHKIVIDILTNKNSVIRSRQFPMRFLQAFKTLDELQKQLPELCKDDASPKQTISVPEHLLKWTAKKKRNIALRKKRLKKDLRAIENYKKALSESIKISSIHNVFPIPGTTLIFCDVSRAMGIVTDPKVSKNVKSKTTTTSSAESAILLALMCEIACEDCEVILFGASKYRIVKPSKKPLLEHAKSLLQLSTYLSKNDDFATAEFPEEVLTKILWDKKKVDNLIVLTHSNRILFLENFLLRYRHYVNPDLLFVNVDVPGKITGFNDVCFSHHENDIYLAGCSDQILRFIAERSNKSQLNYVENIDTKYKLKGIPRLSMLNELEINKKISPSTCIPKWRIVRVFISSTFRDMHGERDLLIRYIFPELRARARSLFIDLHEIDLRWGITEEEAANSKLVEVCLNEVMKCDLFIGILGERYGYIPELSQIPEDPKFDWAREYPPGASITELEFHLGALSNPTLAKGKAFFYIRNNEFMKNLPKLWKDDFIAEDEICEKKIAALKQRILTSSLEVFDQYPCSWGGVVKGKPITADLEEFGRRVFNNIWNAIEIFYNTEDLETSEDDLWQQETNLQEAFATKQNETFVGFQKNITNCHTAIKENSSYVILHGASGSGKTALMARLLKVLRQDRHYLVFPHFVGATPNSTSITDIVSRWFSEIRNQVKLSKSDAVDDLMDPINKFKYILQKAAETKLKIIFLLDGLDKLDTETKSHALAWLPSCLPEGMKIVCSINNNLQLVNEIKNYFNSVFVKIKPLASTERAEMVRQILSVNRKTLVESAFNNQMTTLISKRDSSLPIFLILACEELRLHGTFENLSQKLNALPPTVNGLLQDTLSHLEEEHGKPIVQPALELLLLASHGLMEVELYDLLNLYNNLHLNNIIFEDILHISIEAQDLIPVAKFAKFIQDLKGFLKPMDDISNPNAVLILNHKQIFEDCKFLENLRGNHSDNTVIHKVIAGYFYKLADPHLNSSWSGASVRAFSLLIPHLVKGNCHNTAVSVLTDLQFLEKKAKLGLQMQLLKDYHLVFSSFNDSESKCSVIRNVFSRKIEPKRTYYSDFKIDNEDKKKLEEYKAFISHNYYYLTHSPSLLLQQALNEPDNSSPCYDARKLLTSQSAKPIFQWINKPQDFNPCLLTLTFSKPIVSLATSTDNQLVALGSSDGIIKIFNINTGQEEKSLIGHSNSISSLCFVGTSKLCSASLDKSLSLWDVSQSFRIAVMTGHERPITSCCCSQENNMIVSVGLDCNVWIWNSQNGKEISSIKKEMSPINCVAFHPDQIKIILGLWDCTVRIWDLVSMERKAILRGHKFSVTSVAVSKNGKYIISGALKGEIKLWSATHGNQIGNFEGHGTQAVSRICFFHSNDCIATVGEDSKLRVWSFHLGQHYQSIEAPPNASVSCMVPDYYGQHLFISYNNFQLHKVDISTGDIVHQVKYSTNINCLNLISVYEESFVIVGQENGDIKLLDENDVSEVYNLIGHDTSVTAIGCVGHFIVSGSDDGMVILHDIPIFRAQHKERKPLQVEKSHTDMVTCIEGFQNFATVSRDKSLCVWYLRQQQTSKLDPYDYFTIDNCSSDWITSCCWFSIKEKQNIILGSTNTNITMVELDLVNKKANEITLFGNHQAPILFIKTTNGHLISGSSDGVIKIHSSNKAELSSIPGSPSAYMDIIETKTDICIVDDDDDDNDKKNIWDDIKISRALTSGKIEVLNLRLGNELHHLAGHTDGISDLCVTTDEKMITCSSDKTVRIWQPKYKDVLDEDFSKYPNIHKQAITGLDFNLKKNQLLTCSRDGCVILWNMIVCNDINHLEQLSIIQAHEKAVNSIVFIQEDAADFVTASDDGEINFWKISENFSIKFKSKKTFGYPVKTLTYKEDNNSLVVSGWNGVLTIYMKNKDFNTCNSVNQSWIKDCKFLPNDLGILFADEDGFLYSFSNQPSEKPKKLFNFQKTTSFKSEPSDYVMVNCIDVASSDDYQKCFIGTSNGKIAEVDTDSFQHCTKYKIFQMHSDSITGIFSNLETGHIITASADHYIKVWSLNTEEDFKLIGKFPCKAPVTSFKATSQKNYILIICGDSDGSLYCLKFKQSLSTT